MAPSRSRPNVIWIFGDQHRAQALGCAGDPNLHTPHLDRFAAEGVFCRRAVSGFPLCCPARGALVTGIYPHRHVVGHEYALPPTQHTVAHDFTAAGYHTAWIGKWHLDGAHESEGRAAFHPVAPERRGGFAEWLGYENNNSQYDCWVHGTRPGYEQPKRLDGYETDALTDLFLTFLRERREARDTTGQPFFAALSFEPPHNPYVAPPEWMQRHTPGSVILRPNVPAIARVTEPARRDLAGYYAMIENLDWNFGRIRQALDALDLARDTYILFFSDHGDLHGSHGQFRKTAPWEEAIRVPLIIGGGGAPFYDTKQGVCDLPINMADLAPTSLGLCGLEIPQEMQGADFSGLLRRDRPESRRRASTLLQSVVAPQQPETIDRPWRGVVTDDGWKYCVLAGQPWLMFNLNEDPYEQANLAFDLTFAAQRRRLQQELAAWLQATGDVFDLPDI